jgi:hypothetical protein
MCAAPSADVHVRRSIMDDANQDGGRLGIVNIDNE